MGKDPEAFVYVDPETGKRISTHSMIKTMRRCPKQAEYKYVRRLKRKVHGRPLTVGSWMHKLQEAHGKGEDWREEHARQCAKFGELFDEEREKLGDLPDECARMMRSYLWHYQNDDWKVLETEFTLETEFPDGTIYRAKIDNLIENQFGLWIADHKWHKKFPDFQYRILDAQSALYIWAAIRNGIPVQGHIWNYGLSKPPSKPELILSGARVSRWSTMLTDYPTAARFFKNNSDLSLAPYKAKLRMLKAQQYMPGSPQTSPFFRRVILEKSDNMLKQVAREGHHTSKRMHNYPWDKPEFVERVVDRSCTFMCDYSEICAAELFTGSTPVNIHRNFKVGDPMDYYYDDDRKDERDN